MSHFERFLLLIGVILIVLAVFIGPVLIMAYLEGKRKIRPWMNWAIATYYVIIFLSMMYLVTS